MRIDRFLSECGVCSRSESAKLIRSGCVSVNGIAVKNGSEKLDPEKDEVVVSGDRVEYKKYIYILLNKPEGVVSSTDGKDGKTVVDLLPDSLRKAGLFPCGRLDKDTVGVLLLTNDGKLSHFLLSPKRHVEKKYRAVCERPVSESDLVFLENGVDIGNGEITMKAKTERISDDSFFITIKEGMYHQIKRMVEKCGNKVVFLERVSFAFLTLDSSPERGSWRYLTPEEEKKLGEYGEKKQN